MGIVNFVFRRGAVYTWRRRVPARVEAVTGFLQVSLCTSCPWTARRLAGIVTFQSDKMFEAMALNGLSREAAKKWLEQVVRDELQQIERRKRAQSDSREPGYSRLNAREDKALGHALRILARDGLFADLGAEERVELALEGVPDCDVPKVENYMQQAAGEALSDAVEAKIRKGVSETADLERLDAHQFIASRQIYFRGRAAAYLTASRRVDTDFAEALDLAERLSGERHASASFAGDPAPAQEPEPAYDPAIVAVAGRLTSKKEQRGKATEKTAYQIRHTAALLVEATGISDISHLKQSDLARFSEVMAHLPPTYRKSSKEKEMPLAEICAAAKARGLKRGLSAATVNRNLGFVGQLLKQARSEGLQLDPLLDTRDLREIDQEDEQDKVQPFSRQDICSIFQGPIWQGSASSTRRTKAGKHLFKDGLYWIPIIAAYTGARREEIAGLSCSDIVQEDDIGHSAWKTPTFGGSRTVRPGARCPCTIT